MQGLCQLFCVLVRLVYLIMQSPHIDGRVIETLTNHLAQLVTAVFRFLTGNTVDKRNLRPDNQSQAVATRIQIIGLLIMSKTDRGCTDIHNSSQVEVMVLILQGTSQPPPVLMAGNTVHRILLSIQVKAFTCYNFIFA